MKCNTKKIISLFILSISFQLYSEESEYTYYAQLSSIDDWLRMIETKVSEIWAETGTNSPSYYALNRIRSDTYALRNNLQQLSNFLSTNKIEVSTSNIEDLLKGGYQSDWSVGESAYANYLATQDIRSYFQEGGNLRTLLNNLTYLQTIANNIDELDYLSNINEDLDGIQDLNSKIQLILGGDYSASVVNDNILSNVRSIASGAGIVTNNITDITRSTAITTNLLAQILLAVQTNSYNNVATNNLDWSFYTDSDAENGFQNMFWQIYSHLDDELFQLLEHPDGTFAGEEGFFSYTLQKLNVISNFVNLIYQDFHNTTNNIIKLSDDLHAITNSITAIPKKLDDWDLFYQIFTNRYDSTSLLYYDSLIGSPLTLQNYSIGQFRNITLPELLHLNSKTTITLLGSLNHYLGPLAQTSISFYNNATNLLTLINNAVATNDYARNWWDYIDVNKSRFVLPMYRYHGSNGQTATTVNETINSDLYGFNRVFYNFLPNNLGSINNYLYDILEANKVIKDKISNIDVNISELDFSKISLTNNLVIAFTNNVSFTNSVDLSFTNSLLDAQFAITNDFGFFLAKFDSFTNSFDTLLDYSTNYFSFFVDFSQTMRSPLHGYDGHDYYSYLTNHYINIATDNITSNGIETNYFHRVETLLAALVFGDSDNTTNAVPLAGNEINDSDLDDVTQAFDSLKFRNELTDQLQQIEDSLTVVDNLRIYSNLFRVSTYPREIVFFEMSVNGQIKQVKWSLENQSDLVTFFRSLTTFVWASSGVLLLFWLVVFSTKKIISFVKYVDAVSEATMLRG